MYLPFRSGSPCYHDRSADTTHLFPPMRHGIQGWGGARFVWRRPNRNVLSLSFHSSGRVKRRIVRGSSTCELCHQENVSHTLINCYPPCLRSHTRILSWDVFRLFKDLPPTFAPLLFAPCLPQDVHALNCLYAPCSIS